MGKRDYDLKGYLNSIYAPHHRDDEEPDVSVLDIGLWEVNSGVGLCTFCGDEHKRQECPNDPKRNMGIK